MNCGHAVGLSGSIKGPSEVRNRGLEVSPFSILSLHIQPLSLGRVLSLKLSFSASFPFDI